VKSIEEKIRDAKIFEYLNEVPILDDPYEIDMTSKFADAFVRFECKNQKIVAIITDKDTRKRINKITKKICGKKGKMWGAKIIGLNLTTKGHCTIMGESGAVSTVNLK